MSAVSNVIEVDSESFVGVVARSHDALVVMDFWAEWCAPCRMLTPVLARLAEDCGERLLLAKVNTDLQQELAVAEGIRSLPTVRLYRHGHVVEQFVGAQSEGTIRALIDKHLPRESDALLAAALEAGEDGDPITAHRLLEEALGSDPANWRIHTWLARSYIDLGRPDEAREIMAALPAGERDTDEARLVLGRLALAELTRGAPAREVLEEVVAREPGNLEARYQLAGLHASQGDHEAALDLLLEIMRRDRSFKDDAARKTILLIFDLLGGGPLVARYRAAMSSLLY